MRLLLLTLLAAADALRLSPALRHAAGSVSRAAYPAMTAVQEKEVSFVNTEMRSALQRPALMNRPRPATTLAPWLKSLTAWSQARL